MIEINLENWSMEPLPLNPPLQKGETNHLPLGKGDREGFQEGRKRKRDESPSWIPRTVGLE